MLAQLLQLHCKALRGQSLICYAPHYLTGLIFYVKAGLSDGSHLACSMSLAQLLQLLAVSFGYGAPLSQLGGWFNGSLQMWLLGCAGRQSE